VASTSKFKKIRRAEKQNNAQKKNKTQAPLQALIEKQMECNHNNKTTTQRKCCKKLEIVPKEKRKKPKVHQKF
jgi:hypothetical protein